MPNDALLLGWRKLWNRSLLRFIGRRVRTSVDIEDVAQETYMRLLRARDLGKVQNPQAYLLKVASHVIAEWRDQQLAPDRCEAVDEDALVDETAPEFGLEDESWHVMLEQALQKMPPLTRAVLLLRFQENRHCGAIAKELRLSERQVRRHLTRGYEQLRNTQVR